MAENRRNHDKRPSPEALLENARREGQGRLKIFLGAAPGVGKTFEMLQSARAKRQEGVDVVVGIAETHGRKETQALLEGVEIIPRRRVAYKNSTLEEMDLDVILRRRPEIVLVDELAHSNAPGSRHPKRYRDVEELLAAGIDVYTTVNIQHIESLNDIVAQITSVRVRETVPDSIIDRADDIEVIDITPDDLIQRLKEGKVYVPQTARRALDHYFSPGNLTALRELALRRTAQRVDEQLLSHMQAHAISGPWPAGDRVMVCIDEGPGGASLVRYTRRMADRLRAPWTAFHVETTRSLRFSEEERDRISDTLRLAEQLGGETAIVPGHDPVEEIMRYAEANNVSHIVIGKSRKSRLAELIRGSVTHELMRRAGAISVHVVAPRDPDTALSNRTAARRESVEADILPFAWSTAFVAVALGCGMILDEVLAVQNIALVFLTAVLASAITYGLMPALYASIVSMLAFNFFFLPPLYNFTIAEPENVVALFFFLVIAVIASNLTARVRSQAVVARQRAKTTEDLYLFSRKLAGTAALDDVLWATAFQIASMLKVQVVILLAEGEELTVRTGYPPEDTLDDADVAAAKWAFENNRTAGRGSDTLPGAKRLFIPMRTGRGVVGVIGIDSNKEGPLLTPEQQRLLDALIDQAALAVDRVRLAADADRTKLSLEADRLRSALLTSISHDLKTPLASIIGAAGTLRDFTNVLTEAAKRDLVATVQEEADRLNRFIANLLDMTRIESGAIEPQGTLHDVGEIVGSALQRASKVLAQHRLEVEIAGTLPMLKLDAVLFEQVLFNILDNAAKYAPASSTIRLKAWQSQGKVVLQILDEGDGIPPEDCERIFDKFYRVRKGDRVRAGTGLGLPICRGFIEAMGGTIEAANRPDRSGAVITIKLPVPTDAPQLDEVA
ncbi:MAG: sensor histidine kinase KdpD [Aestuariivirgaceae bacterium]